MAQNAKKEVESIVEGKVLDETNYHKFSIKYGILFLYLYFDQNPNSFIESGKSSINLLNL